MAFERFEAEKMRRLGEPAVSIFKRGGFGFNRTFCLRYLDEHDHIQLFYDRENMIIGIKPVPEDAKDAIGVRRISGGKAATVAARPFFTYFEVPHNKEKAESFKVFWNEEESLIEVRLKSIEDDIPMQDVQS
ncbi:hypothetical protein MYX64_07365 [Nitrospinae bacterium AH_259_B05_G02_I21]|nr:hypothetical protein [Nitrospinae bacterium AH_259_B05_G02_I21]MDA2931830.1 hypothetical protein [Nitrospinae bacterium AH-259-F20]